MGSISEDFTARAAVATEFFAAHTVPIPGHRPIYAMGETPDVGAGPHWMDKLMDMIGGLDEVKVVIKGSYPQKKHYTNSKVMRLKRGKHLNPKTLNLQLADRAKKMWDIFQDLQKDKKIPADAKMLVDVYVLDLLQLSLPFDFESELDTILAVTQRELAKIWEFTDGNVVFLLTMPTATVRENLGRNSQKFHRWAVNAYTRLIGILPQGAEYVLHPCYARAGNRALFLRTRSLVYRPKRTVRLLNDILARVRNRPPLAICIPMAFSGVGPVLRSGYYKAYRKLTRIPGMTIFAGAAYYDLTGSQLRELKKLFRWLDIFFGQRVGVCYTCGFGSLNKRQMLSALECQRMISTQT